MKSIRIALNGFGRIGRHFFRRTISRPEFEWVAINDLADWENLVYLLKYDTAYGRFNSSLSTRTDGEKKYLFVDDRRVRLLQERDPSKLPWKELKADIVVEATGAFDSYEKASAHLAAGVRRVVLSAPAKDADTKTARTVLVGANDEVLAGCRISSNGSCTTNSAHPVVQIMHQSIGIKKAFLSTTHGYTATQNLVDAPARGKSWRRGRAAAQNIVPSSTGAAIAVTRAVTALEGKFDGVAMRVPVVTGSASQIIFVAARQTTVEEVNDIFRRAVTDPRWRSVFTVTEDQLVSADIVGEPYGAIVDLEFTRVVDGDLVYVLSWYDNEMGYVQTLIEHVLRAAASMEQEAVA